MPLSLQERNQIRTNIAEYMDQLGSASALSLKERNTLRTQIAEALEKLNAQVDLKPDQNQDLADLISGKFNEEPPERFIKILDRIYRQINDIEPLKQPSIDYIDAHISEQSEAA